MPALPAFVLYAFVTSVTPGPNNIMLAASGANFGFRRTVPHILGIQIGFAAMIVLIGLGLGAAFQAEPRLELGVKIIGVGYLFWLAYRIATAAGTGGGDAARGAPMGFLQAALFQWVNIKAWMMAIGTVVVYAGEGDASAIFVLAFVFALVGAPSSVLWAGFGVGLRRVLSSPERLRMFNLAMAGLLILSVLPMIL